MCDSAEQSPSQFNCPACGGAVLMELADHPQVAPCPHCGQSMVFPGLDGSTAALAQPLADETPPQESDDDELDGLRIRRVAQVHRAAYRGRGYYLMGAAILLACGGQLILVAALMFYRQGWQLGSLWRLPVGVLFVVAAVAVFVRAQRLLRTIKGSGSK